MAEAMRMPALGQTSDELRIIGWLKAEGESLALGEPLLEVETDKAALTVESALSGTLLKIVQPAEATIPSGTVIAYIGRPGEQLAADLVESSEARPPAISSDDVSSRAAREGASAVPSNGRVLALPAVRKLALEHGIDLDGVRGSGPDGRIERKDVQSLIEAAASADSSDHPAPRHRQVIAQRLTRSAQTIPQITLMASADMTRARALLDAQRAAGLPSLGYTHLILRAVARALRAHPRLNALWLTDGPTLRTLARANVGLAIAAEDNLLVATIAAPDRLSLPELVGTVGEATQRGRSGALAQADTAPAAITVSNLGMHRVDAFLAIVDPDQTAILAVGRVAERVVVNDGGISVAPQVTLSLTVDHRVAGGVAAARFLETICAELERGVE